MKKLFLALALLTYSLPAFAHWHFNEDGGFGIYQPEGWNVIHNGRSSRLLGPERDSAQSNIFLGSDWISHIGSQAELERYVRAETGATKLENAEISGLHGFKTGTELEGAIYLLRFEENVIVIEFSLRGSREQLEEGKTMLSSIEIKTKPIEN